MTEADKVARVQVLLSNDTLATDSLVTALLSQAEYSIYERLYPFGLPETPSIPPIYEKLQCALAVRYFSRMGAEGESHHNEGEIKRTYATVNDEDLLNEVTPYMYVGV